MLFTPILPDAPFRQGDIFRVVGRDDDDRWLILVTADCDIANDKFGNRLTFVTVYSATDYLEEWCESQCEIERLRLLREISDEINSVTSPKIEGLDPIDQQGVSEWVKQYGRDDILNAFDVPGKVRSALGKKVDSLSAILDQSHGHERARYRASLSAAGRTSEQQNKQILQSLKGLRGDYVFLPVFPGEQDVGFVAALREIVTLSPPHVHRTIADGRSSAKDYNACRIGRLADFLRFSVVQQFASLFARIGMTEYFENESEMAMKIISESV